MNPNPNQWAEFMRLIKAILEKIARLLRLQEPRFNYGVGPVTYKRPITITGGSKVLEVNITNEQQVVVHLNPVTATGRPAQVQEGSITWTVQNGNATVTPSEDGKSATIVSADAPGDTSIVVDADADLGEGVVDINDIVLVHVAGAMAASLGLSADEPTPKP